MYGRTAVLGGLTFSAEGPSMKILVVDDEAGMRDFCSQVLSSAGYEVATVASGEEAVLRLEEGWDIVLTDLSMTGIVDGNEVVRRDRKSVV